MIQQRASNVRAIDPIYLLVSVPFSVDVKRRPPDLLFKMFFFKGGSHELHAMSKFIFPTKISFFNKLYSSTEVQLSAKEGRLVGPQAAEKEQDFSL